MGYFKDAAKGISWSVALRGYTRGLSLLRIIILARFFLNPYEFGLFSMVTLVISFLEILTETGINVFLIQEKRPLSEYINSAWIVSIARGTLIAIILLLAAYPVASFFNTPAITTLLLVSAIIPFAKGFINPSEIVFQKELQFEKEFFFRSAILTIETLAILLFASIFHNAFSFIFGMIISAFSEVTFSFIFIKLKPKLQYKWNDIKHIFHRGKWVTLYGIFQYFSQNADNITVGKVLGASNLAIYSNAYNLSILPVSEIVDVANKVIFPIFVKIKEDKHRLLKAFLKTSLVVVVLTCFVSFILGFFAKQIVLLTFGPQWLAIATILPLLAVYGALRAIFGFPSSLLLALNRQDQVARIIFVRFIVLIIAVIPLTISYGLQGTVYAALLSVLAEIPISTFYTLRIFIDYEAKTS